MSAPHSMAPAGGAPLDPLRFPLHGRRLIEASAGTGKTFTIAALYVRLVLGHGGADAFARALAPPEILVVTFTEAATKELRERIRARLAEAAAAFLPAPQGEGAQGEGEQGEGPTAVDDDFLARLRADHAPEHWPACARKLQLAAEWMDEAAVSTIHGWCKRMLREHAFASGSLFTQTLEADQGELLAEAVRDYWRTFIVPLDAAQTAEVARWWSGPQALQQALERLVGHAAAFAGAVQQIAPAALLGQAAAERERRLAALKAPWPEWADELQALLERAVAGACVNGHKLRAQYYLPWLDKLRAWAADRAAVHLELGTGWSRLTPAGLADAWKADKGAPPSHPALEAVAALPAALAALPDAFGDLLRHAACWVAARFAAEQQRRAQMGFDDLLTRLDRALQGDNGARLAERIRSAFPVALIDEFQDTDPVQFRIFDAVYGVTRAGADGAVQGAPGAAADPQAGAGMPSALVLIGDPKQAIYAFRGADIFTYLAARRACAGRRYTLGRNFRSTAPMVAAVNRCFGFAEARSAGAGAFLFRAPGASPDDNPLPFVPAAAQGRKETLEIDGRPVAALTAWWLAAREGGKSLPKGAYREQMAAACATAMVRLLNRGRAGAAGFVAGAGFAALRPRDLAVLVHTRDEADAIRAALAVRGVRSVYLSDRDSVFDSARAEELQHWLAACAEPDDARLLRAALATATLGLEWAALDGLDRDERAWEARVLQFRGYRELWRRQGVLPMLRRLLHDFDVPARLLGAAAVNGGERALTDLLHLAELLQQASAVLDGEHALIRHLACQRQPGARPGSGDEGRQIRLESDADLVQVVTVHKSKGLEYPLVFLPFACSWRRVGAADRPLTVHDAGGRAQLLLCADEDTLARADRERLGEDLRKLYVALTRARHATWVGLAPLDELEHSAFGYLLAGGAPIAPAALEAHLLALKGAADCIAVAPAPEPTGERYAAPAADAAPGRARRPRRSVREHWWIASYSALKTGGHGDGLPPAAADALSAALAETEAEAGGRDAPPPAAPDSAVEATFHETLHAAPLLAPAAGAPAQGVGLHAFPRGAEAGTFLHELLEWAAERGFASFAADPGGLRDTVARRCRMRGWEAWSGPLTAWLEHFLAAELPLPAAPGRAATRLRLAGLGTVVAEMEFWLTVATLDTRVLDRLVCAHTLDAAPRPALLPDTLGGMLKGFIDLLFEHEGRFYVADYKSNWLGADDGAYTAAAMRAAVLAQRYELQYTLYLLALHRLLKARLPGYDYDRHVGGALYLFLRGSRAPGAGVHFERPPKDLIEALDRLFAGADGVGVGVGVGGREAAAARLAEGSE